MDGFTRSTLEAQATEGLRALIELLGDDPDCPVLEGGPRNYIAELQRIATRPPLDLARLLRSDPVGVVDVTTLITGDFAENLGRRERGEIPHVPIPTVDGSAPVMAGPVPWSAICQNHLMPFGGVSWVAHDPGPRGYPPAPMDPADFLRRRALGWRVPARALAVLAGHMAGGLTSPDHIAVQTAEALHQHLGGAGSVCRVRVLRPCPAPHRDRPSGYEYTVMHGRGGYADPEYMPSGEVTTDMARCREFMAFVHSGTVLGTTAEMCSAAATVAGRPV